MLARRIFPLATMDDVFGDVDRIFDIFKGGSCIPFTQNRSVPPVNVWEDDKHLHVEMDVPGMTMDNLEVEVVDRNLVIKGNREESKDDGRTYHRRERVCNEFVRSFSLDDEVDAQKVDAVLKNGVLTVLLSKNPEIQPRRIEVKAG